MVSAMTAGGTRQSTDGKGNGQRVAPAVPFIRATGDHYEQANLDRSAILTTADQDLGVIDLPAYGYVRKIWLLVTASGGTGGTPAVTATEDAPFTTLKNISLSEPNGAIIHMFNSGYDLYLANKWGGFRHPIGSDVTASPVHTAIGATFASYQYITSIPVDIDLRSGLGALPNQNSGAQFKLKLTLAKVADIVSGTLPTTLPTVRIQAWAECYDQPELATAGAPNQVQPPAMGTTQFWSTQIYPVASGDNTIRLTRMGNYLRSLIFVLTRTSGTRANGTSDWPTQTTVMLDSRPIAVLNKTLWQHLMYERSGYGGAVGATAPAADAARGLNAGVFVYDFCHEFDGLYGRENRDGWLPTLGSTRLEIQGSFGNAGSLKVLTNDVAITGNVFI